MSKDYNIDDILSEVKKRRQETEQEIIEKDEAAVIKEEPVIEEAPAVEKEPVIEETPAVEDAPAEEEFVDLMSLADKDIDEPQQDAMEYVEELSKVVGDKPKKDKTKKKKVIKTIIIILLVIILVAGSIAGIFIYKALNTITDTGETKPAQSEEWKGMDELVESFNAIEEADASVVSSLEDMIKQWYYNGEPSSSTHVLNIMLVGEDTRGDDIKESGTRADSAMICSINIDQKTIHLTSILRDSWAYWEKEPGNESTGTFSKINESMARGNIHTYINAVERLYKIKIDNYVIVNFDSFEKIIDKMGGVTLELTSAEIREINNHPKRYGNVTIEKTFDGTKGEQKLTGKQALAYCRIRKLDSDNMRANRQKTCLTEVAKEAKEVSPATLLKMANALIPYVKTDMPKGTIVKVAKYALTEGWLNYEVSPMNVPDSRINQKGSGGNFRFAHAWIWKADYPQDAYTLQMKIYGTSPITLARERVDYIKVREQGFYSELGRGADATITNYHYGEATTQEPPTKDSTEE